MTHALWYASRATGLVALLLLTATVTVGALHTGRLRGPRGGRLVLSTLHSDLSLLILVFLVIHAGSAVLDPYAGIRWVDAVVPFASAYQPMPLGLGAVAFDLLLALLVTSLTRALIGLRGWRIVHWLAYVCWPVAIVHGLLIGGADSRLWWVLLVTAGCAVAVTVAVSWRLVVRRQDARVRPAAARDRR
ncbi:ferric reductase-like transmembrane domain-containing protein [Fodinicola acaciae]|uniref:ferric reductase-like transmembrane domain-containing protein n=1 Tax=Fodinicola acaciae TaxID=2681555 RepID=UPI0013D71943|nr:ferric reductase-like transmembrane domain-containing protein [Fodinicola acaciae]